MTQWYRIGTCSVTSGAKTVTFSTGVTLNNNARAADELVIGTGTNQPVEIASITDNLHCELVNNWPYATATDSVYAIIPGPNWDDRTALALDVATYLAAVSGVTQSSTTLTIGTGSQTLQIPHSTRLSPGAFVTISDTAAPTTRYMAGVVTSYVGSALTVDVTAIAGSGSGSSWNVNVGGAPGATGSTGAAGPLGNTGPAAWSAVAAWAASTAYVVGPPASVVTYLGETYVCTTSHTSTGSFDASKFSKVAAKGADAVGITDGDKGDIVVSGSGSTLTIDPAVISTFARTFLDDTSDAEVRATLKAASWGNGASGLAANNLIVNGAMEVSDEWNFASGTTPGAYYAEQWQSDWSVSTGVISGQASIPGSLPGFNRYNGLTATAGITIASAGYAFITQRLTGARMQRLRWGAAYGKSVKIGFWLFSTATGVASVGFRRAGGTHAYVTSVTITSASTWVWYTVTIPAETTQSWVTDNTHWGQFFVTAAAGSSWYGTPNQWNANAAVAVSTQSNLLATTGNLFALTGVVLLPGDIEMPPANAAYLAQPNIDDVRHECLRFWERVTFINSSDGPYFMGYPYRVKKRATPALALTSGAVSPGALVSRDENFFSTDGRPPSSVVCTVTANARL